MIDSVFNQVVRLDESKNYNEMLSFVKTSRLGAEQRLALFWKVFSAQRLAACYVVAVAIIEAGADGPAIRMVEFIGSLMFSNGVRCPPALEQLRRQLPTDSSALEELRRTLEPLVAFTTLNLFKADRLDAVLTIRDAWTLLSPGIASAFGESPPHQETTTRLLSFPTPPPARSPRRAVVAIRKYLYTNRAGSRLHDFGPRLVTAMQAYGWLPDFHPMQTVGSGQELDAEYRKITELCRSRNAEVLVIDEFIANTHTTNCANEIIALKKDMPNLKVIVLYLDTWSLEQNDVIRAIEIVDYVWNMFPALSLYRNSGMAEKVFEGPYPMGGMSGSLTTPLTGHIRFVGGIQLYNWHRAFWIAAAQSDRLRIEAQISSVVDDGLSALDSYRDYFQRLEKTGCCLNFSMRLNESRILTGRAFEAILAGALLVQEETADMPYYFKAGEHYLSFATYAELREIARFIAEEPAEAEAIRRRGFDFACARYADDKAIGYLDGLLFNPPPAR
ncbi:MAG: glycosyltransferase [Phaeospirillum sp.]|nr:glycosyltransferase [Phaeospirillum sp.]